MRELISRNRRWFVACVIAGFALRLLFLIRFPAIVNDSFLYGDIAKNWLQHGIYGLSGGGEISPTLARLPGYPGFLAIIFAIFGMEHYRAVLITQIFIDIGTCLFCADIARRLFGVRAAKIAFLMAALCPFLANYSAAALTETLEVFFTAAAFDCALAALQNPNLQLWAWCGICCGAATLLRPDGALLVICITLYLVWEIVHPARKSSRHLSARVSRSFLSCGLLVVCIASVLPLVPWTIRNWRAFHTFQPLAPRYANEQGEYVPMGFNRWVKTWMADFTSVQEIYWQVPGSAMNPDQLPSRAFDSEAERQQTQRLFTDYNNALEISPQLDSQFESLARARIHARPLRYYVVLPALRILDMWLRPRTEMLPSDPRWWEFNDDLKWSVLAVGFGAINLIYVLCALVGCVQSRHIQWLGLLIFFVLLRSLFLGSLENPEPRYTLEMYPIVIVLGATALAKLKSGDAAA